MKNEESHPSQADWEFILHYFDGTMPEDEKNELNKRLEADQGFRQRFVDFLMQRVHLSEIAKEKGAAEEAWEEKHSLEILRGAKTSRQPEINRRGVYWRWAVIAAAVIVVGLLAYLMLPGKRPKVEEKTNVVEKDVPAPEIKEKAPVVVEKPVEKKALVDKQPEEKEPAPEPIIEEKRPEPELVEKTPEDVAPAEKPAETQPRPEIVEKTPVKPPAEKPAPTPKTVVEKFVVMVDAVIKKPKVKRKDGKKWEILKKGDELASGDELKTGSRDKAVVFLPDSSAIIVNSYTELAISDCVELKKGEIYVQVMPQMGNSAFDIVTPFATVMVKGTEFNLKRKSGGTTLTIIEGTVKCSNDKGSIDVAKGFQATVTKTRKPSNPRKLSRKQITGITRWAKLLLPVPKPVADAKLPAGFGYYEGAGKAVWGRTKVTSHSGRYSAFLKGAEYEDNFLNVALVIGNSDGYLGKNAFNTGPSARYSFSFWIKGNFKKTMYVCLTEWQTNMALKNDRITSNHNVASFIPTTQWTRIKGSFTTHRKAIKFIVHLQANGSSNEMNMGVLYVDDIVIQKEGSKKNIVENPGLETGRK